MPWPWPRRLPKKTWACCVCSMTTSIGGSGALRPPWWRLWRTGQESIAVRGKRAAKMTPPLCDGRAHGGQDLGYWGTPKVKEALDVSEWPRVYRERNAIQGSASKA
jgi:hypothetical protein